MKNILFAVTILMCFSLLVFGKIQYDNKLKGIAHEAQSTIDQVDQQGSQQKELANSDVASLQVGEVHPELQDKLISAINNSERLRVAFVGSNAMAASEGTDIPWPALVIDKLNEIYGDGLLDVTVFEYGNRTSHQLLEVGLHNDILEFQPDVLLFEPFILNDNGNMTIDVTLENVSTLLSQIQATSQDVFVVLQPPNPIYLPNYYLEQVRELRSYAEENDFTYIDHWDAWPSITDIEIQNFIEGNRPNQKGHEIWANVVIEFFTGK